MNPSHDLQGLKKKAKETFLYALSALFLGIAIGAIDAIFGRVLLFAKAPQTAVPSDRTRFQKESDTSPSLCPSTTGSAKEEPKIFPAPAHAKLQMP